MCEQRLPRPILKYAAQNMRHTNSRTTRVRRRSRQNVSNLRRIRGHPQSTYAARGGGVCGKAYGCVLGRRVHFWMYVRIILIIVQLYISFNLTLPEYLQIFYNYLSIILKICRGKMTNKGIGMPYFKFIPNF